MKVGRSPRLSVKRTKQILAIGGGLLALAGPSLVNGGGAVFLAAISLVPFALYYFLLRTWAGVLISGIYMITTSLGVYFDALGNESSTIGIRLSGVPLSNLSLVGAATAAEAIVRYLRSDPEVPPRRGSSAIPFDVIVPVLLGGAAWAYIAMVAGQPSPWLRLGFWIPLLVGAVTLGVPLGPQQARWQAGPLMIVIPVVGSLVRSGWAYDDALFLPLIVFPYIVGGFVLGLVTFIVQHIRTPGTPPQRSV